MGVGVRRSGEGYGVGSSSTCRGERPKGSPTSQVPAVWFHTYCNVEEELARESLAVERDLGRSVIYGVDERRTGPRLPIPNERVEGIVAISISDSTAIFNRHSQSAIHVVLGGDGRQGKASSPVAGRVRGGGVRLEAVGDAGHRPTKALRVAPKALRLVADTILQNRFYKTHFS